MIFSQSAEDSEKDNFDAKLKMISIHVGNQREISMIGIKRTILRVAKTVERVNQDNQRKRNKKDASQKPWKL